MTKADRVNAIAALVLMALLAGMGHHLRGNSLRFTVVFPAVMWMLWFWVNRAQTASAFVSKTEAKAVFERPLVARSLYGFFSFALAFLIIGIIQRQIHDAALYQRVNGVSENSLLENLFLLLFLLFFVGLPCFLFVWMAGPCRIEFDFEDRRYLCARGLPLVSRTKCGAAEEGRFSVLKSRARQYQMKFSPPGDRIGYVLETYETDDEARTEAQRLADKLGVVVERRDYKG